MRKDSRERQTLGRRGSMQIAAWLSQIRPDRSVTLEKEDWARQLSTTRWQDWAAQRLHLATLPAWSWEQSVGTFFFCRGQWQSCQHWGKEEGGKKFQILTLPPALAHKEQGICQRSKGVLTPRLEVSKQGSISCPTYLPFFHRHFLGIHCVPGMCWECAV